MPVNRSSVKRGWVYDSKLCPFLSKGCDKIINTIENTHSVVIWDWGLTVNQTGKAQLGRFLLDTSMQNQCYQHISLQHGCFGRQLSTVSVTCEFF